MRTNLQVRCFKCKRHQVYWGFASYSFVSFFSFFSPWLNLVQLEHEVQQMSNVRLKWSMLAADGLS